ncbi:MAG: cellulose synthase operon protein YhjQ/BcsQ [Sphingobium sp.]
MPLILCHSPKGGVGTTFLAAHLAIFLARQGHEVAALDFTYQDALKLSFGLLPTQQLPEILNPAFDPVVVAGVELFSAYGLRHGRDLTDLFGRENGAFFNRSKIFIADVAAGDRDMKEMLLPHAMLHICALHPRPGSLAALTKIQPGTATIELPKTVFVLNHIDDTHRLSRHTHLFLTHLFGDRLIGTVRRDEAVNEAAAMFEPLDRFAPNSVALADLARLAAAVQRHCDLVVSADERP